MEDFVPFELAKKLKEKGFREKCLLYYAASGYFDSNSIDTYDRPDQELDYSDFLTCYNKGNSIGLIDAPTTSQVLKWLRKNHATHIEISLCRNGWYSEIIQYEYYEEEKEYGCKLITISVINDSYEEATLAGIEYVIDNLI